ncbi:MAG TPA: hypothetical protein DEQ34_09680 [Balneolaceae bacterium]|nr:hypothetical protein [Balneolaceae bacterium]|tara:strand:- start:96040 stop:96723 length:684 start_codon:yes stop_codon:yes gene_type:complete
MIWTIITAIITSIISTWLGYRRLIYLHQLSVRNVLFTAIIALLIYSAMLFLFKMELMTEAIAGTIIANVYASIFGFFAGSAIDQYQTRANSGDVLYINRTFISEYLPVIIASGLILLGLFRSSLFTNPVLTPIRLTSGLSLMAIGIWGYTIRMVPEFRKKGIILIDSLIDWEDFLGYKWYTEDVLEIEYLYDDTIRSFKTLIPSEEQMKVETMLALKMKEKVEEKDN